MSVCFVPASLEKLLLIIILLSGIPSDISYGCANIAIMWATKHWGNKADGEIGATVEFQLYYPPIIFYGRAGASVAHWVSH